MPATESRRMMMAIKRLSYTLSFFLLFFIASSDLQGQVEDFQSWWEFELNKEISDRLNLNGELEQRFKNNSLLYNRTLLTLATSYDFSDYFRLAGGMRTVFVMDGEQQLHARYRIHIDGTGRYDLSGFDLSLRIRLQYGFEELLALRYLRFKELVNRNRLKVAHHIYGTRFGWFASVESWHGLTIDSQLLTVAMRYSVGARFSPNFTSRFSLRYILEDEFNVINPEQLHVVVMGYTHRF